jgi:hypothetical protein
MGHDEGNPLKSQDNHEGLRALPLNSGECEKFHHQQPRPIDPDPFELPQLTNLVEARVARGLKLGTTFCFDLRNLLAQKGVMSIHAPDPITQTRRNGRAIPKP